LDDIKDIVEDQKINQANLAYSELIRVLKKQDIDYKSLDITMIENYLYVTGVAGRILQSAIHYFIKAKKPILNLELPIWFEIVEKQIEFAKGCLKTIDDYLDEIKIKVDSI
jgi:hypothetical protein